MTSLEAIAEKKENHSNGQPIWDASHPGNKVAKGNVAGSERMFLVGDRGPIIRKKSGNELLTNWNQQAA